MRNKPKKIKKRNFFIKFSLFIFICYLLSSFVVLQKELIDKRKVVEKLNLQISQMELKNQEANNVLNSNEEQYIKKIARDKLGYISPGGRVFVNVSGN